LRFSVFRLFLLPLISAAFSPCLLQAKPVNSQQVEKTVKGWLRANPAPLDSPFSQQIDRIIPFFDYQGQPVYYAVYLHPDGFVILPADDEIAPILAFAPAGTYDPSPDNPLGALVSQDLPARINAIRNRTKIPAKNQPVLREKRQKARQLWDTCQSDAVLPVEALGISGISDVRVAPLVASTWGQGNVGSDSCYNYYTPNHYLSGCVATGMAQLMRYHAYPAAGVGTASFPIYVNDVAQSASLRGGDGLGGPYQWADMVLQPDSSITDVQRQAIGALCYDAGVSISTKYSSGSSSAALYYSTYSLKDTFYYTNAVYSYYPTVGEDLNEMINPNLDGQLPVLLGVRRDNGGHVVVCDGYGYHSSILYHHLNMGWNGSTDNVWYNLPDIDTSSYDYTVVGECVYNIFTSGTGEILSGRITSSAGFPLLGVTVTATARRYNQQTTTNENGIYAFLNVPSETTFTISAAKTNWTFSNPQSAATTTSQDWSSASGNGWGIDFTGSPTNISSEDFDLSGYVDVDDLAILAAAWLAQPNDDNWNPACDISSPADNIINFLDLAVFAASWLDGSN